MTRPVARIDTALAARAARPWEQEPGTGRPERPAPADHHQAFAQALRQADEAPRSGPPALLRSFPFPSPTRSFA